jgi:hypothetical protein
MGWIINYSWTIRMMMMTFNPMILESLAQELILRGMKLTNQRISIWRRRNP